MKRLALVFGLLATVAGAQTFPPDSGGGGGGGGVTYPLTAPCGTISAPSYAIGNTEMGTWCTGVDGTLVLQNRDATPDTAGRSRLSLGVEFFSLHATRSESTATTGALQCFDESGTEMICRFDLIDGTNTLAWLLQSGEIPIDVSYTGASGTAFTETMDFDPGFARNGMEYVWQMTDDTGNVYREYVNEDSPQWLHRITATSGNTGEIEIRPGNVKLVSLDVGTSQGESHTDSGRVLRRVNVTAGNTIDDELQAPGRKLTTTGTQVTCNVTNRGYEWREVGAAGVADTFQRCEKDANDVYAWRDRTQPVSPFEGTWTDGGDTLIATITGTAAGDSGGGRMDYHFIALNAGGGSVQQAQECFFTYRNSSGGGVICSADPGDSSIRQSTGTITCDCSCTVAVSDVELEVDCNTSGITEVSFDASGRLTIFGFEGVAPDVVYP